MHYRAVFLVDSNNFRAAGYATLLMPWAVFSETDLHISANLNEIDIKPHYECVACIICVGGASLSDPSMVNALSSLRDALGSHPLIALSDLSQQPEVDAAMKSGLRGFISTDMPPHVAIAAIQFILAGGTYLPLSLATSKKYPPAGAFPDAGTQQTMRPPATADLPHQAQSPAPVRQKSYTSPHLAAHENLLKPRHLEVLAGLSQGHQNKVIARNLNITEATVKLYVRQLLKIFDAKNRTQLALKAAEHPQVENQTRTIPSARKPLDAAETQDRAPV